jgi:hypothetical protein
MAASEQSFDGMHMTSQLPLLFFLSISLLCLLLFLLQCQFRRNGGFVSDFLCLDAVGCTTPILFFLLSVSSACSRRISLSGSSLAHIEPELLLHIVESIVGWICCKNGGAFRRLDHSGSLLRLLSLILICSLLFFCSRFLSFSSRNCVAVASDRIAARHRFPP